jgi:hypothetical protein
VPTVERFEELRVWQQAREIVELGYHLKRFPFEEPKLRESDSVDIAQPETGNPES